MSAIPRIVVHDVDQHGVAGYARTVANAVRESTGVDYAVLRGDIETLPPGSPLHVQFTDRLWAGSPEEAAEVVRDLAARHPLTVTFHDVPQASDGARNLPRRSTCYRAIAEVARAVVVNSAHEAALLREHDVAAQATVIPLPVDRLDDLPPHQPGAPLDGSVGVLGFFYPGKGHGEALDAAVAAGIPRLTVLGRASDGHSGDLDAFVRGASARGVTVEVTGYLDDEELVRRCRRVAVPVIAHRHVSASGSLGSWIAAGRRPVATANRYVDEMAALRPGTITVAAPERLAEAVVTAVRDPESTWLAPVPVQHGRRDTAEAYLAWWESVEW